MPTPDNDSIFVAYKFTAEEARNAKIFTALQLAYLQTMRAGYATTLASLEVSPSPEADRDSWLQRVELQTKVNFVTELFDNHTSAIKEMVSADVDPIAAGSQQQDNAGERAAKLVHKET